MKTKVLFMLIAGVFSTLFMSSCLDTKDEREENTAASEREILKNYLDTLVAQGHDIDTTEMGVYYVKIEDGDGDFAQPGDTLTVGYAGYFIGGTMFDSSEINSEDGKMEFVLEDPPFIAGWDDVMKVMNEGAKIQAMIPSELAYGSTGQGIIPPYETLVFVIELFDIKPSQE
ncbi:MAG: FKBP-type peptidyl-prolyl cis-trans isomerase [Bacteroidota bacterium]